ncbi:MULTISPECIES: ACP phosphodiesterase [Dyella]|uniref:DUF479 domain-containing protein n=2 Tax=Dyella TaxID=231454 RepID=A0A4R0YE22_9GAMM|nr:MULTISPECIES: ACP phosphodiesterase [Dyella]TBR36205.1 DUF479 domain-containing protein [Dyella terrae]TCI06254.1 DUF479 domain-containing protein [Dyella soli]
MNHLAHALLAGDDEGLVLGGLMGDFVHGRLEDDMLPARVLDGIRLHRAIDVYTDAHPEVVAAKAMLPTPYRRYGGILLDMWFDHDLARDFARWSDVPLADYSRRIHDLLHRHDDLLPDAMRRFRDYMDAHDLPAGYADPVELDRAFRGVSHRLTRANPVGTAMPVLAERDAGLRERFEAFFPQLMGFAEEWRGNVGR